MKERKFKIGDLVEVLPIKGMVSEYDNIRLYVVGFSKADYSKEYTYDLGGKGGDVNVNFGYFYETLLKKVNKNCKCENSRAIETQNGFICYYCENPI